MSMPSDLWWRYLWSQALGLLVLVFAVVLPSLPTRDRRSRRSVCASNLKQLGLAAKTWSLDNGGRFPWQVSTNEGGTLEIAASPAVFRHFLAMSNQVEEPKILVCPVDKDRQRSAAFAKGFTNSNLSYFVGLDSDELHPESILSGDRNLALTHNLGGYPGEMVSFISILGASQD